MVRFIILISVSVLLVLAPVSFGHPPSDVGLEFDPVEHLLVVTVNHGVKDAAKHYVNKITVELNGKGIITQEFKSQDNTDLLQVMYKIVDAKPGDTITVTAACNISGKRKGTLELPKRVQAEELKEKKGENK